MSKDKLKATSKSLSYVLRHQPDSVGLELQEGGWVDVEKLLDAFARSGQPLSLELLERVVTENDKQRFEFSADHSQIRARQGHSAEVDLGYKASTPPDKLYHGTATRNLDSIFEHGLVKGQRHHVHMSTNIETIDAAGMHADGHEFFVTGNNVWLTDHVPAQYLSLVPGAVGGDK
jgi:putative RNA 2'-phosphotransferase